MNGIIIRWNIWFGKRADQGNSKVNSKCGITQGI